MFYKAVITAVVSFFTYDFFRKEYGYYKFNALGMACCAALLTLLLIWTISEHLKEKDEKKWQANRLEAIESSNKLKQEEEKKHEIKNDDYDFLFDKKD